MTDSRLAKERAKSPQGLGKQIEVTENSRASSQLSKQLAQRNIQRARERNSLVPINRLPTELLIAIFDGSLETFPDRFEDLHTIASVAWLWNSIVKRAPGLWAVLDSSARMERLLISLQRAGDFPLRITMHREPSYRNLHLNLKHSEPDGAAFLDMVLPKLARWKEAKLFLQSKRQAIPETLEMLEKPAPLLRKFFVNAETLWWESQVDLFQGHAPDLAELSIYGLPIRWSSSIFHNLRSVSIWGVMENGPTVEDVFQWMVSSARLRSCHLSGSALSPSAHHQAVLPIEIPHLQSLILSDLPTSSTQHILSRIRAPAVHDLVVRPSRPATTDSVHLPTFFNTSLLHFRPAISSSIAHAHGLRISIYAGRGSICVSTTPDFIPEKRIQIEFYHQPVIPGLQSCLELLLQNVPFCPPISLVLVELNNVPESDLVWILDSEINDKVAEVDIRTSGDDPFLPFLCKARYLDGVAKWPLPKLKRLLLPRHAGISKGRLARLLRQRYAPDLERVAETLTSNPQSPLILEAPDRLTYLDIENTTLRHSDYDSLANIVGRNVVMARICEDDLLSEDSQSSVDSDW